MSAETPRLFMRRVQSDEDVDMLRCIRNVCRNTFSHDQAPITEARQKIWWEENQKIVVAYIGYDEFHRPLGFAMVRLDSDGIWKTSVAVLPTYQGKGIGRALTRFAVRIAPEGERVRGTALLTNTAGVKLHIADDWIQAESDETYAHFDGKSAEELEPLPNVEIIP